jgi:hypothetical protein
MEFYEVQWTEHNGVFRTAIVPYSEIIGFSIYAYETSTVYLPVTKRGGYDLRGLPDESGKNELLKWKKYISDKV